MCDDAVGTSAIHEIVVYALACLCVEGHAPGVVLKDGRRIVLPVEPPALDGLQHVLEVLQVRLLHALLLATAVHLAVLDGAQSIDGLVLVEDKGLAHGLDVAALLFEQHLALSRQECQVALHVLPDRQYCARQGIALAADCHLFRPRGHYEGLGRLSLDDMDDAWGQELNFHVLCK